MAEQNLDLIKEQRQRAYGLYEQSSKSLRLALVGVLGLAIILFPLTFYPYANFRGALYSLQTKQAELGDRLSSLQADMEVYTQLMESFDQDQRTAVQTLSRLQAVLDRSSAHDKELEERKAAGGNTGADSSEDSDPCYQLKSDAWARCVVDAQLTGLEGEARDPFISTRRVSHLKNKLLAPLDDALSKLHNDFQAWLHSEPSSWNPEFLGPDATLSEHYGAFISAYENEIDKTHHTIGIQRGELSNAISGVKGEQATTDAELATVTAKLKDIASLQNIETPFGKLPVGINDLMLLFPILLAAGALRLAHLQNETMQLRGLYHRLTTILDPQKTVFSDAEIMLTAPVWIDPLQSIRHQLFGLVILLPPALLFAYSVVLLLSNRLLWGPAMDEVRLGSLLYIAAYGVVALAVVYVYYPIVRPFLAFERYRRSGLTTTDAAQPP